MEKKNDAPVSEAEPSQEEIAVSFGNYALKKIKGVKDVRHNESSKNVFAILMESGRRHVAAVIEGERENC